jgi:hypothetical protein
MESSERRWCDGVDEAVVAMGRCVRKREAREGVWAIKPKPSRRGSISGAPSETAKGDGGEMWCGGVYEVVVVVVGLCAHETRGREGVWAKTRNRAVEARFRARRVKRRRGMVRMGGVVVYDVVVVVGSCVRATRGAEWVWAQKPETELPWLGFGLQWGCRRWRGVLWVTAPLPC